MNARSHGSGASLIANLPPELVNNPQYEVLRELGRGGMGVVCLAKNKLMDRGASGTFTLRLSKRR